MKKVFFIIILFLILIACKKEVEKERPEFIGYWVSSSYGSDYRLILEITENSYARYSELAYGSDDHYIYGTARANDQRLKIGRFHNFKIHDYPHQIDTTNSAIYVYNENDKTTKLANWEMTIYRTRDMKFYKTDY